jgi:hypothetical protein
MHYSDSELKRKGVGLSFVYWQPTSVLIAVPLETQDFPFAFTQVTKDFQEVTVQGQLTYRVVHPEQLAALVDYTIDDQGKYLSDAPALLSDRIIRAVQIATKDLIQEYELRDVLDKSDLLTREALVRVKNDSYIKMLGVEILATAIHMISPNPAMARALEAATRENLQKAADEAMYDRRRAVVEQERIIKEKELLTEVAVEEKKRQIRETKIAADIAIEEQREVLMVKKTENDMKEADTRAYTLEANLKPLRNMDWKVLMAVQNGQIDAGGMIALAFREMAENAGKIGELNISPDLLNSLVKKEVLVKR